MNNYNHLKQFVITNIMLFRKGWKENEKYDIKDSMYEFLIYEDISVPTISATLIISDTVNISDKFPILGGERVEIYFKTPIQKELQRIEFSIGKISKKYHEMNNSKFQALYFELVTLDRYTDINIQLSESFSGNYTTIIKSILSKLNSNKKTYFDETLGNVNYIAPNRSPLVCCKNIEKRCFGTYYEPFFFYENLDGYNLKSIKTLSTQDAYTTLKIENGKQFRDEADSDLKFRRVLSYEYMESNDKMRQFNDNVFGCNLIVMDTVTKRFSLDKHDYLSKVDDQNFFKLEKNPIYDDMNDIRSKQEFTFSRNDKSHQNMMYRKMVVGLIDNFRLKLQVPGDSGFRVGQIINLNIPSKTFFDKHEDITSGKWLIMSLKHVIKRESYTTILEVVKDSYSTNVINKINDVKNSVNTKLGTSTPDQNIKIVDE